MRPGSVGNRKEANMAKGQKKSNKEIRKPKAEKPKASPAGGSGSGMIKDANR